MNLIFSLLDLSNLFKIAPVIFILVAAYFLFKGLEMIFKVIFYIVVVGLILYFFKDAILNFIFMWL